MYNENFLKSEIYNALSFSAEFKNVWNNTSTNLYFHNIVLS